MMTAETETTQCPSIEEWVLATIQERGPHTLDQLGTMLPHANWAQLLLAVDRLSRHRDISMRMDFPGDYLIAVK